MEGLHTPHQQRLDQRRSETKQIQSIIQIQRRINILGPLQDCHLVLEYCSASPSISISTTTYFIKIKHCTVLFLVGDIRYYIPITDYVIFDAFSAVGNRLKIGATTVWSLSVNSCVWIVCTNIEGKSDETVPGSWARGRVVPVLVGPRTTRSVRCRSRGKTPSVAHTAWQWRWLLFQQNTLMPISYNQMDR